MTQRQCYLTHMYIIMISALISIALYGFITARLAVDISQGNSQAALEPELIRTAGLAAILFHAIYLYSGIVVDTGLNLGFFNTLALLGWVIAVVLIIGAFFEPVLSLGIAIFPGAALTMILMMLFPSEQQVLLIGGWPMKLHVLSSILAYSLFSLAAVQVILLTLQDRAIRSHKAVGFVRTLPPLQTMEALLFQMILSGFVILSFSLLTGAIYITDMFAQHLVHKTVLSIISWGVFGTLLWGRWQYGWRGRRAMIWTLSGFVVLGLAYPVTKFILEIILQR